MKSRLLRLLPGPSAAIRSTLPTVTVYQPSLCLRLQKRFITAEEKPPPEADKPGLGPNQEQLPDVSEEAAATGKIMGDEGPDIEQGTPVQEILKREQSQVKPPRIIQEELQKSSPEGDNEGLTHSERIEIEGLNEPEMSTAVGNSGHIFHLPTLPLPESDRLKQRYDPLVLQVTNLLMRHGKKALAQRNMALILNYLRSTAPPKVHPGRPLIESIATAASLPLDPVRYLRLAIDSIAPLIRVRATKGPGSSSVFIQVPIPLRERQRRRTAVMWILNVIKKRRSKGSGRTRFAHKIAEELVAIVEGRSALWDRRGQLHNQGISARSNLSTFARRRT